MLVEVNQAATEQRSWDLNLGTAAAEVRAVEAFVKCVSGYVSRQSQTQGGMLECK